MPEPAPRAVVGIPLHNGERHVAEAIRSLAAQTLDGLRLVVVDDCSSDRSPEIVRGLAETVPLRYVRSERRLGLVEAWRQAFALAVETHPEAPYFAWGSDHDVWQPEWLAELVAALEACPQAVLAYPLVEAIGEEGEPHRRKPRRFETRGIADAAARVRAASAGMRAGDMVYGLYRVEALAACGPFPATLLPDRLLLGRLSVEGELVQVERTLWQRRYRAGVRHSLARQRRALFGDEQPLAARLPWWAAHAAAFHASLAGRPRRLSLTRAYVTSAWTAVARERREARRRRRRRRTRELRHAVAVRLRGR